MFDLATILRIGWMGYAVRSVPIRERSLSLC
jgi:hypothetical protein